MKKTANLGDSIERFVVVGGRNWNCANEKIKKMSIMSMLYHKRMYRECGIFEYFLIINFHFTSNLHFINLTLNLNYFRRAWNLNVCLVCCSGSKCVLNAESIANFVISCSPYRLLSMQKVKCSRPKQDKLAI